MTRRTNEQRRLAEYERMARPGYVPETHAVKERARRRATAEMLRGRLNEAWPPSKEHAPCCLALRLPDGRPVLGFCSPECVRRPGNWRLVVRGRPIPPGGVPPRPATSWTPTITQ